MPFAEASRQRIYFEDIGTGPPVILGHSFLCTGQMWRGQIDALSDRYRFINPDFRGHGQSDPAKEPFTLYDAVADAIAVLDALGIQKATWCGLSIGGMVALRAALVAPERVQALVLLDSDAGSENARRILKYRMMGLGARTVGVRPFLPAVARLMFGKTTRNNNPALTEEWRAIFAGIDVPSMLQGLECLVRRDSVVARLSEIRCSSLVAVGDQDGSLPPARSRRMHDGLVNSEFHLVLQAGHLSALEQPGSVNAVLADFLQRVSEPG